MKVISSIAFFVSLVLVPRIGVFDVFFIVTFILAVLFFGVKRSIPRNRMFSQSCWVIPPLFIFSAVSFLMFGDLFGLLRFLKFAFLIVFVPLVICELGEKNLFKYLTVCLALSVLILYFEYFDFFSAKSLIRYIQDWLYPTARTVEYRARGLFPGYSAAGVSCGFIAMFSFYFSIIGKINKFIGFPLFFLSSTATIITGRTGMLIFALSFLVFSTILLPAIFSKIRFSSFFVMSVSSVFLIFLYQRLDADIFDITIIRTFEFVFNYLEHGSVSSESTTQLYKTFALPHQPFEIFFGNGMEHWSPRSMAMGSHQTDSGIFQVIFIYGVFGFFLYYLPIISILVRTFSSNRTRAVHENYLLVSIPLAFLAEFKGHYIYSSLIFVLVLIPAFFSTRKVAIES
ncbi:hypothetical protein [Marinobacter halophilus]|uniref:O-antigen ligase domain-containing protein n=1 Tax=Marinobacter halophilus TaxID=1323740 RepID=A0A2T1KCH8_9GAMM|nr:hypothetical protein [Marinobacter halophilus]PSF07760.1 hypothetical protein C7H08_10115 [Marinobacter halophilus]